LELTIRGFARPGTLLLGGTPVQLKRRTLARLGPHSSKAAIASSNHLT